MNESPSGRPPLQSESLTGGQALVRQLVREGAEQLFALPGVQLDWAVDPLIDHANEIALCVPRHEQATSYMADGYARATGKTGVCMVVPGPGVLNCLSGLATAYACSSSVVCIAGQIATNGIGRGYGMLHEVKDQSAILRSVTKWSALAETPDSIPALVREAFRQARSGQKQPTAVEVPPDVLQGTEVFTPLTTDATPLVRAPDGNATESAAALLSKARTPMIYAGGGVLAANASDALLALAEQLDAPVVMSENGRGGISDRHPLAVTALGGRALLPHTDVVLVVGSRYLTLRGQPMFDDAPNAKCIYLNVNEADTTPPRAAGLNLIGDARLGLEALRGTLTRPKAVGWGTMAAMKVRKWCDRQFAPLEPQMSWLRAMREAIPDDGIFVNELTQNGYLATVAFPVYGPRTFITPGYQGTLGYGLPTAIGAAIGNRDRAVISISGDGGFGWNMQELATAARYDVPVISVVFVDGAFGNVRRIQSEVFGRQIGADLHNPDFVKLAESFGVAAARVATPAALAGAIREAVASRRRGPLLLEVPVGEMPSPWHLLHRYAAQPQDPPGDPLSDIGTAP